MRNPIRPPLNVLKRSIDPGVLPQLQTHCLTQFLNKTTFFVRIVAGSNRLVRGIVGFVFVPFRHDRFKVVGVNLDHVVQRKHPRSGQPPQTVAFSSTHCTTSKHEPRPSYRCMPLGHVFDDSVLPQLTLNSVVWVPRIIQGFSDVDKITVDFTVLGTIVFLCGGRAPFVFNYVVGMGVGSGGGLCIVVLCADFERVFVGQGGDDSGKEHIVSDGTDKHTDPDNTLPVRVALLQE